MKRKYWKVGSTVVVIAFQLAACQERREVSTQSGRQVVESSDSLVGVGDGFLKANSKLTDLQLGPLAESMDEMKARLKAHDELAQKVVDQTSIGEWAGLLSFVSDLVRKVETDNEHLLSVESIAFDYYSDLGEWQNDLPEHAKRLLPQGQLHPLTEAGYVCKLQLKLGHGAHIVDEPTGVMAPSIEHALGLLHAECRIETPKSEQDIWISHSTVTGLAFDGTTEFYMLEFVWHRKPIVVSD